MSGQPTVNIIAIITTNKEKISGGAPTFIVSSQEELQSTGFVLEKIMDAVAHEVNPETLIIVKH